MNDIIKNLVGSQKSDPDYSVYELKGRDKKIYIGITKKCSRREREHRKKYRNKEFFGIRKDGYADFEFNTAAVNMDFDSAIQLEQNLIHQYRAEGFDVLNITGGGELADFVGDKNKKGGISTNNIRYNLQKYGFRKLQDLYSKGFIHDEAFAPIADGIADVWLDSDERACLGKVLGETLKNIVKLYESGEIGLDLYERMMNDAVNEFLNSSEYNDAFNHFIGNDAELKTRLK